MTDNDWHTIALAIAGEGDPSAGRRAMERLRALTEMAAIPQVTAEMVRDAEQTWQAMQVRDQDWWRLRHEDGRHAFIAAHINAAQVRPPAVQWVPGPAGEKP